MLSGRGLCDELITRLEESYGLCCVVVCDIKNRCSIYIYDISSLRVKGIKHLFVSGGFCRDVVEVCVVWDVMLRCWVG